MNVLLIATKGYHLKNKELPFHIGEPYFFMTIKSFAAKYRKST